MMKASAMTTKMDVALFTAIIRLRRYYNCTGYKIVVFKFIAKGKKLWKNFALQILGTVGQFGRPLEYATDACGQ